MPCFVLFCFVLRGRRQQRGQMNNKQPAVEERSPMAAHLFKQNTTSTTSTRGRKCSFGLFVGDIQTAVGHSACLSPERDAAARVST